MDLNNAPFDAAIEEAVSNKGCDDQDESPPGHKSHAVDRQSPFRDDTVAIISEHDEHLETPHIAVRSECAGAECLFPVTLDGGVLSLKTNALKTKSRRMQRREHGCREREIIIGKFQFENFATDSVGHMVMSRLLAKLTTKSDVKI